MATVSFFDTTRLTEVKKKSKKVYPKVRGFLVTEISSRVFRVIVLLLDPVKLMSFHHDVSLYASSLGEKWFHSLVRILSLSGFFMIFSFVLPLAGRMDSESYVYLLGYFPALRN